MNLQQQVVEVTRLGRKSEGKIRPVRVRFTSQFYRDVAVTNGFVIKYMDGSLNKAKIIKDLIRDDREKAKMEYENRKQLRLAAANNDTRPAAGNEEQVPPRNEIGDRQGAVNAQIPP